MGVIERRNKGQRDMRGKKSLQIAGQNSQSSVGAQEELVTSKKDRQVESQSEGTLKPSAGDCNVVAGQTVSPSGQANGEGVIHTDGSDQDPVLAPVISVCTYEAMPEGSQVCVSWISAEALHDIHNLASSLDLAGYPQSIDECRAQCMAGGADSPEVRHAMLT